MYEHVKILKQITGFLLDILPVILPSIIAIIAIIENRKIYNDSQMYETRGKIFIRAYKCIYEIVNDYSLYTDSEFMKEADELYYELIVFGEKESVSIYLDFLTSVNAADMRYQIELDEYNKDLMTRIDEKSAKLIKKKEEERSKLWTKKFNYDQRVLKGEKLSNEELSDKRKIEMQIDINKEEILVCKNKFEKKAYKLYKNYGTDIKFIAVKNKPNINKIDKLLDDFKDIIVKKLKVKK